MRVLEKIRYFGFWIVDFLKGSKLRKHYRDITFIMENYDTKEAQERREAYLTSLIKHATQSTDFYKSLSDKSALKDLPVINKNMLRENKTKFYSNTVARNKKYSTITTGSTGTPLEVFHDKNKKLRNTADVIYFSQLANFKIGYKLLYLRKWSEDLIKSPFLTFIQNIEALEVMNLDDSYISSFIKKIEKDNSVKGWIGYASGFDVICKYLDRVGSEPVYANIKGVIAVSEALADDTKKSMSHYFNTAVVSRYSNMENGIIAQQLPNSSNEFLINCASYYIEVLELDSNAPVKKGQPGRIVITDLFNYCMPMIRYDTGDIGKIDYTKSPPVFKNVEGRKTDVIFNTRGNIVPSMIIASIDRYEGIIQGQLIQEGKKNYILKLNTTKVFNKEAQIIEEFKGYLGSDAQVSVIYVNEIPLLDSGKRRATVNNYFK